MSEKTIYKDDSDVYYLSCSAIAEGIGKSAATVSNIIKKRRLKVVSKGRFNLVPLNNVDEFSEIIKNIDTYNEVGIDEDVTPKSRKERQKEKTTIVTSLESQVQELKARNDNHLNTIVKRRGEIQELKSVNLANKKLIEQLKTQIKDKEEALKNINGSARQATSVIDKKQETIIEQQDFIEYLNNQCKQLKDNLSKSDEEKQELTNQKSTLQAELSALHDEIFRLKGFILVNVVNFAAYFKKTEGTTPIWDDKIELVILGAVKGFVRLVEKAFNIINSNPATFVVLALIFAIWEGTYHGQVMHRPGLAIVIQLTAVLVAIFNLTKKEERRIAKQIAKSGRIYNYDDDNETPWLLIVLGVYNFSLTYLSFIHYTDLAGDWKNATKEVTKIVLRNGFKTEAVETVNNSVNALFSHHGNYVAIGLSLMFAAIVSGCINIYVKKSVK